MDKEQGQPDLTEAQDGKLSGSEGTGTAAQGVGDAGTRSSDADRTHADAGTRPSSAETVHSAAESAAEPAGLPAGRGYSVPPPWAERPFAPPSGPVSVPPIPPAPPVPPAPGMAAPGMPGSGTPGSGMPGSGMAGGWQGNGTPGYGGPPSSGPGRYGGPAYGGFPGQMPFYPPKSPGKGLAIAALSVAGVGLLFCWIWFLNFITFLLGFVALGLGIPALVKGLKARNVARPLAIAALSVAVFSMIAASFVNATIQYGLFAAAGEPGLSESEPGAAAPAPAPSRTPAPSLTPAPVVPSETPAAATPPAVADKDYSVDVSGPYFREVIAQPANSAGESVQVGDYSVTLVEVNLKANDDVLQRDPDAGAPDHNYVLFEFNALYNGDATGRTSLDLGPQFIGADSRMYSVLNCSMNLGVSYADEPTLSKGESATRRVCFDLPAEALGEDSRVALRMTLAENNNEPVYWRLP